jgi:mannose-6-phosphate isomerase
VSWIKSPLYPLRFEPIYQYRLWGGRRLANLLSAPLPGDGPIGEAWLLSDRDDHPSRVADGPLKGRSIGQLLHQWPEQMLGKLAGRFHRFPLLLKFLDVRDTLSVQVHPIGSASPIYSRRRDRQNRSLGGIGGGGKKPHLRGSQTCHHDGRTLRQALANGTVADHFASFTPKPGDGIFIPAGTVHSLGDVVVFEVQENSDVTFRLYDWNHIDAKTGHPRPLQVDQAMACIDFAQGAIGPVVPMVDEVKPVLREWLFDCEHFGVVAVRRGIAIWSRVPKERRGCWCASPATVRWSTMVPITPSARGMCCSCRPWLERVCADPEWCHQLVGNFASGRIS